MYDGNFMQYKNDKWVSAKREFLTSQSHYIYVVIVLPNARN